MNSEDDDLEEFIDDEIDEVDQNQKVDEMLQEEQYLNEGVMEDEGDGFEGLEDDQDSDEEEDAYY